jgi:tetratricopeptide (TPR) repeat protein
MSAEKRLTGIVLALMLSACWSESDQGQGQANVQATLDLVAEATPFPRPALDPVNALPDTPPLPDEIREVLDLRRAFFAGDFARLDRVMTAARDRYLTGKSRRSTASDVVRSIEDTELAGIDSCAAWLLAMPDSYSAHWLCSAMWTSGAWAARGTKYAKDVSAAQFVLMRERLQRSNALLERALTLTPKPVEALTQLAENHYMDGKRSDAETFLYRAEKLLPRHLGVHSVRMHFSLPEWGGSRKRNQAWLERAKKAGVDADDLLFLEDEYVIRPAKMSSPGAAQGYWEQAIRKRPLRSRQIGLLEDLMWREIWHDALPVANRLIRDYPGEVKGYYQRAVINEKLGLVAEAHADFRMAAAMGDDYALQRLILSHVRGGLGVPGKTFQAVAELCRFGASLGSPVGTNCLGASFYEGGRSMPFEKNLPQAFAWHLMGARAGHFNSQYDLGWLLFTGRGPGVDADTGKRLGIFWLRRAAEQDHQFARRKLEENRISLSEEVAPMARAGAMIELIAALLDWIFAGSS